MCLPTHQAGHYMPYWDRVERFHAKVPPGHAIAEDGLRAVRFLRSFFERMGCEALAPNHPLHNRLSIGMDPNYLWLAQYGRKLLTASRLAGFEQVARQFADGASTFDRTMRWRLP